MMKSLQYILDEGIMDVVGDINTVSKGLEDSITIDKINNGLRDRGALFWKMSEQFVRDIRSVIPDSTASSSWPDTELHNTGMYEEGSKYKFKTRENVYLDPSTKEQLDNDIFLGIKINELISNKQIVIDNIQNISPDVTYSSLAAYSRMYIIDARNVKDMNFELMSSNSLFCVDTMYPILTVSNTKILFSGSQAYGKIVFNGTSIPILNNVESNCRAIGISNDDLFTNKKNKKLIDMFDWSKVWEYPDGKKVVVKDINTLHSIVKFIRKQYKGDWNRPRSLRTGYTPEIPIGIMKDAKVSDFINISKMPDLDRIRIAEDVLMFEFFKDNDMPSYSGIVIGETADGWKVLMTTDLSNDRSQYKYW